MPREMNFNSVLLAIVIAISGWSLKESVSQGNTISKFGEQIFSMQRDLQDFRIRMAQSENELVLLKIQLAKLSRE